ncbi:hypothetical protein [Aeromicrobium fastidiosum]|jgi:hypothetical protein|uniref:Uncharacterized protein n=1 Tax=Aeromicrobium fastidiosum TaxID=52699 RepID=A0A641AL40_9ACTN|nr:hypothetical protein [Aeromicrobium fastidiosum]KAA1376406.1 hypothetical protein ESP62_013330 [Aeromicrobium fastidiosum]MBP2391685.1 hypothetical protein [Aeromicrobium fastidiosum]
MSYPVARSRASVGPRWLMALLAPALILGIVLMHSLLLEPASVGGHDAHAQMALGAAPAHHSDVAQVAVVAVVAAPDGGDPMGQGTEGGMADCSGLMAMCLALLVSFVALIGWPRGVFRWVLWQRPPPTAVRLGTLRDAFEAMTARQRTTVLRC